MASILGQTNILVGEPKVGKSSFISGLLAAIGQQREEFLGRSLNVMDQPMPLLVFGTDQGEGDWLHYFRREGLVDENKALTGLDFSVQRTGPTNSTFRPMASKPWSR